MFLKDFDLLTARNSICRSQNRRFNIPITKPFVIHTSVVFEDHGLMIKSSFPDPGWGEENVRIRPSNTPRSRYGTGSASSTSSSGALPPFVMVSGELLQLRPPPPKVPPIVVLSSTSREIYISG
jgi:hypothetical protein